MLVDIDLVVCPASVYEYQCPAYSSILENRGHGLHEESNRSKQSEQRQERQESRHRSTFSVFSVYFVVSHCSGNCREGNVAK